MSSVVSVLQNAFFKAIFLIKRMCLYTEQKCKSF